MLSLEQRVRGRGTQETTGNKRVNTHLFATNGTTFTRGARFHAPHDIYLPSTARIRREIPVPVLGNDYGLSCAPHARQAPKRVKF